MLLRDNSVMNPKGDVKLELYNEEGVFFEKEKKNLVVAGANEIVANMMADPSKKTRVHQVDEMNDEDKTLVPSEDGFLDFHLSQQGFVEKEGTTTVSSSNQNKTITLQGVSDVEEVYEVTVGSQTLERNQDFFVKDAEKGIFEFSSAPTEVIRVKYLTRLNSQVEIIEGTEIVKVDGEVWSRAKTPNNDSKRYAINHKTGVVKLQREVNSLTVSYDYMKSYGLGFMTLGTKPNGHPDNSSVQFSQSDRLLTELENEIVGSRVPIEYPSTVEEGKNELDLFTTTPVETESKTETYNISQTLTDLKIDSSGKKLYSLERVTLTKSGQGPVDLQIGTEVQILSSSQATIQFQTALDSGDDLEVEYKLVANNLHLNYQLSLSPVVELVSVVHEHATTGVITNYTVNNAGMVSGSGDVWLLNPNAGILQFRENPSNGVPVHTPGQLTVQYKVNSGKTVKFIADFPKGVPGPIETEVEESFTGAGETVFTLSKAVKNDDAGEDMIEHVKVNGAALDPDDYTLFVDRRKIEIPSALTNDVVEIKYSFDEEVHKIYTVAMFDRKSKEDSKMFNISGIGPVTKDENTGMRITWSVTF